MITKTATADADGLVMDEPTTRKTDSKTVKPAIETRSDASRSAAKEGKIYIDGKFYP